jgi:hypothetical protein
MGVEDRFKIACVILLNDKAYLGRLKGWTRFIVVIHQAARSTRHRSKITAVSSWRVASWMSSAENSCGVIVRPGDPVNRKLTR